MLKLGALSIVGLAVYGWLALEPGQFLKSDPPPKIFADKSPIRHRPEDYVALRDRLPAATDIKLISNR